MNGARRLRDGLSVGASGLPRSNPADAAASVAYGFDGRWFEDDAMIIVQEGVSS